MRSVVVVFPASMWAMMPMFLHRSNGTVLGTALFLLFSLGVCKSVVSRLSSASSSQPEARSSLPPVMCECLVRFRHTMHVFFLLDSGALAIGGIEQLVRQLVDHSFFAATARIAHDPADGERRAPVRTDFDRHLVVRATDAARLHFEQRLGVFDRLLEQLEGLVAAFFLQLLERLIEDPFSSRLLALPHHGVDELGHQIGSIDRIRLHRALRDISFSRHCFSALALPRSLATGHRPLATVVTLSSGASYRISNVPVDVLRRRWRRAFHGLRDSARPAGPSRGRRGSAQSSAPGGYGRRRGCRS